MKQKIKSNQSGVSNADRTLVVFDTNRLYDSLSGENDYSIFDPKGDVRRLKEFIIKNKLDGRILIGLSEVVLKEYCNHRKEEFLDKLNQFKQILRKLNNLDCCDFESIQLPEEHFDYEIYINEKVRESVSDPNNSFVFLPLEEEKHSDILKRVLHRAVGHKKPFDERGDKGFKDAMIFESLIEFQKKNNFAKVILYTGNLKDFAEELSDEFSRLTGRLLTIESNYQLLEQTLEGVYRIIIRYPDLLRHLKTDYFKDQLEEFLVTEKDLHVSNFRIIDHCSGIEECTIEDLERFGHEEYLEEIMDNFKVVSLDFENNGKKYTSELLFDLSINEIIGGDYKEKSEVQAI